MTSLLRNSTRFLLDLLAPNCCPCCDRPIAWNQLLCPECQLEITVPPEQFCERCGKQKGMCLCQQSELPLYYDKGLSACIYEGKARHGILELKQGDNLNFAYYTGQLLGKRMLDIPGFLMADAIVPVPMNRHQRLLRGKNPALRIANAISEVTHIPVKSKYLWKKTGGSSQHQLRAEERRKNVMQFRAGNVDLHGHILILCDDVLTTGSTLNRCAELLKQCGAEAVYAVVSTTAEWNSAPPQTEK